MSFSLNGCNSYAFFFCKKAFGTRLLYVQQHILYFASADQPQLLDLPLLFAGAAGGVDAGGVDAAVAQDVGQAHHVLIPFIIGNGKQMP